MSQNPQVQRFRVQVSITNSTDNPVVNIALDQIREKVLRGAWRKLRIRHCEAKLRQDSVVFKWNCWFEIHEDHIHDLCGDFVDYVDKYIKDNNINGDIFDYHFEESDECNYTDKICDASIYVINNNNVVYVELTLTKHLQGDYSVIELKRKIMNMAFDSLPNDRNDLVKIIEKLADADPDNYDVLIKNGKTYIMPID